MTERSGQPRETFYFIPHTHWEGAVFKTREEYLEMGLPNILLALRLLQRYPEYRFLLDQTCYIRPFLERYPEEEAAFRRFVAEGRLAIVGGLDVMPDVNMPGGESFVRQVLCGKGYLRRALGVDPAISWQLDTFGHHSQMPQLLRLAGYKSFWFFRGVSSWEVPSEFIWEGLDGSRIPAYWLPQSYAVTYGSPSDPEGFARFFEERFALLAPYVRGLNRVGPAGADVCEPEEHVPPMVAAFNARSDRSFDLRIAVPADYEAAVEARPDERPVIGGELNPIFQGTYSSRIELKQQTRELEALLGTAEGLGVLLSWLGLEASQELLWRAWEPMLFNHTHDLMSGVMTDHVYADTERTFDASRRLASEEVEARVRALATRIDTRGEGIPVVVYNPLGWSRTDLAVVEVGFGEAGLTGLRLVGPDGVELPLQVVESDNREAGGLLRAKVAFVAAEVPALGYAVYRLLPSSDEGLAGSSRSSEEPVLENQHYRVTLDATSGAITGVTVKEEGWQALDGPGNVVTLEEDKGDLWEVYRPLDGGSRIAMQERHPAPAPGQAQLSTDQPGDSGQGVHGPVVQEFSVTHPLGKQGRITTTIRLVAGSRRIEVRTRILNQERFVRYRVLFTTAINEGQTVHEVPFGAVTRPEGVEFPAQNWIDWGNGERGVALLNRGLPGNNAADGTLILSLLRCTSIVAYGFGGGYEPGMTSDTGFEEGRELTFDYALVPHEGDWRQARLWREGMELNWPLIARTAAPRPGPLPTRWGFLEIDRPNVVVSALKPAETGGAVLRLYEAAGEETHGVTVRFSARISGAAVADLMEDAGEPLPVLDDAIRLDFHPFEIKTIRLDLRSVETPG